MDTRKCVIGGEILSKEEMLRFTLLKDGTMLPDLDKKIGGRGFYLPNSRRKLQELCIKKKPLNRVLHDNVIISDDLPEIVAAALAKKGLDMLNIARKSGELVLGFEKVRESVLKGRAALLVVASDSGADGMQKICSLSAETEKFQLYDTDTLSKTLRRENSVYLAIIKGHTEKAVRTALQRYQTYLSK